MPLYSSVKTTLDNANMASGNRNYWGAAEQPTPPYTILSRIAAVPENTLSSGVVNQNTRIQIDAYARSYVDALTLAGQIRTAMAAAAFTNIWLLEQDLYDDDVKLHRVVMDYSIWNLTQ